MPFFGWSTASLPIRQARHRVMDALPGSGDGRMASIRCRSPIVSGKTGQSLEGQRSYGGCESIMPVENNFQHAEYSRADPGARGAYPEFEAGPALESPAWQEGMGKAGSRLEQASVRAVIFFHGSCLNSDPFGVQRLDEAGGLKRGYSRGIPGVDGLLALMRQETNGMPALPGDWKPPFPLGEETGALLDQHALDGGNFSNAYVSQFKKAVNRVTQRAILCRRWLWSSEHHHLGRTLAACEFLDRLVALNEELRLGAGDRVLVYAHGQAGVVLALLSNMLASSKSATRDRLLQFLQEYLAQATGHDEVKAACERAISRLGAGAPLQGVGLDVVTFGTPIRYGWDLSGIGRLMHVVNHRMMRPDAKRWLAKMELPQITMEMPIAWGGDYIQQLAVAGSDAVPEGDLGRAANKAVWELLEPYDGFERWLECARRAVRCANDGHCALVDYKDAGSSYSRDHFFGHAAYTRQQAMLFNTALVASTLYP